MVRSKGWEMTPKQTIEKNELEKMKYSAEQNHNFSHLRKH